MALEILHFAQFFVKPPGKQYLLLQGGAKRGQPEQPKRKPQAEAAKMPRKLRRIVGRRDLVRRREGVLHVVCLHAVDVAELAMVSHQNASTAIRQE